MAAVESSAKKQKLNHPDPDHSCNFGHELGNEMVEIYVGPSKQHFSVHKKLLCAKADYFQNMFENTFTEGTEQAAIFPKEYPDTFTLFVQWIYVDSLRPIDISKNNPPEIDAFLGRVRLYCFAEKICLPALMDYTMTTLLSSYSEHNEHPSLEAVVTAYQSSSPESRIRDFMSRYLAWFMAQYTDYESIAHKKSPYLAQALMASLDLTTDVVKHLRGVNTYGKLIIDPRDSAKCSFHNHPHDQDCKFKDKMLQ